MTLVPEPLFRVDMHHHRLTKEVQGYLDSPRETHMTAALMVAEIRIRMKM
jgi:hypothetical protein